MFCPSNYNFSYIYQEKEWVGTNLRLWPNYLNHMSVCHFYVGNVWLFSTNTCFCFLWNNFNFRIQLPNFSGVHSILRSSRVEFAVEDMNESLMTNIQNLYSRAKHVHKVQESIYTPKTEWIYLQISNLVFILFEIYSHGTPETCLLKLIVLWSSVFNVILITNHPLFWTDKPYPGCAFPAVSNSGYDV